MKLLAEGIRSWKYCKANQYNIYNLICRVN
jgi:hypothetical protein